jgi:hypothetical protein
VIVRLNPASDDGSVWMVSVPYGAVEVPVDFTRLGRGQRSFLGERGGLFEAECEADGWRLIARADH